MAEYVPCAQVYQIKTECVKQKMEPKQQWREDLNFLIGNWREDLNFLIGNGEKTWIS